MSSLRFLGRRPEGPLPAQREPDWLQADPAYIERALQHALALPGGQWYVLDATDALGDTPKTYTLLGRDWVVWRHAQGISAAPDHCPHMGASLGCARIEDDGSLRCPWHGLKLAKEGRSGWQPLRVHDDGVLLWVQLATEGEEASELPFLPRRPASFVAGVIRAEARCEASDILANRLDPWHGAHYHPHSFAQLQVLERRLERLLVRVSYRVVGSLCVEVDASFRCPNPRCIVMTIEAGEGVGSVVETHATPLGEGRSAVIEATLATSERAGFALAQRVSRFVRPFIEKRAARLWVEDIAYAERRYALRVGNQGKPASKPRQGTERSDSPSVR